ncbi:unnamed protein product [Tetraodon nigroviridis]|uniref:(spotted green pufferfish) hypothetical protein n=1 Tax=Tetraodon nigroviridis TaxID=99883 RepID=Q4RMU1_TETNG|nr:unnamed protein product [Tetraodon nigroviridis]
MLGRRPLGAAQLGAALGRHRRYGPAKASTWLQLVSLGDQEGDKRQADESEDASADKHKQMFQRQLAALAGGGDEGPMAAPPRCRFERASPGPWCSAVGRKEPQKLLRPLGVGICAPPGPRLSFLVWVLSVPAPDPEAEPPSAMKVQQRHGKSLQQLPGLNYIGKRSDSPDRQEYLKEERPSNTAPLRNLILKRRSALKGASSGSPGWKEPMAAEAAAVLRRGGGGAQAHYKCLRRLLLVSRNVPFELQTCRILSRFQVFDYCRLAAASRQWSRSDMRARKVGQQPRGPQMAASMSRSTRRRSFPPHHGAVSHCWANEAPDAWFQTRLLGADQSLTDRRSCQWTDGVGATADVLARTQGASAAGLRSSHGVCDSGPPPTPTDASGSEAPLTVPQRLKEFNGCVRRGGDGKYPQNIENGHPPGGGAGSSLTLGGGACQERASKKGVCSCDCELFF